MPDFDVDWKGDFALTADGDLAMIDGIDLDNQHITRRLLTAVRGYVFHQDYGAGLPQRIGRPTRVRTIQAIVRAQLAREAVVASVPVPAITVNLPSSNTGLCTIAISYTNAISNTTESIALEVPTN